MGVAQAMVNAAESGYRNGRPDWCNLGQGQPDVGRIEGAPSRLTWITLEPHDQSYGPPGGIDELREAVASHYNRPLSQWRVDSKYKKENVSIASGGRLMLSRIFATFDSISVGHKFPDSPAYHDLFSHHLDRIKPVPVQTGPDESFRLEPARLGKVIAAGMLRAFLIGNPCNPTGDLIRDADLKAYLTAARKHKCTLVFDEVLLALHLRGGRCAREWAGIGGLLRPERGERSGAHRRRPEQELPVSGVAAELGGRTVECD